MSTKTIVITGASDGIGAEAARALDAFGHTVVVVGRSPEKTEKVADAIGAPWYVADFARLDDVRRLAAELRRDLPTIDVLANNAGGILGAREVTVDGHEKTMQVNHLAPFLLTNLLLDVLIASRASVIATSSVANIALSRFDIDDLDGAKAYQPRVAYGNAKLENILFTRELDRRYHDQGISAAAFHPGIVASNFASETTSVMRRFYQSPLKRLLLIPPSAGADTLVWLATTDPGVAWHSGGYYVRRRPARLLSTHAKDPALARALWERSAAFCGL
jgi:NAD(P)-dependent dehydrogenase (short-subunit alcohol dehydrogenase family)